MDFGFDFELILVSLTATTGLVWAADVLFFARRRRQLVAAVVGNVKTSVEADAPKEPMVVDYSRSFFPVLLAVLLLRSFLVEPFRIPSGSMIPTLLVGDFILVNKFAYGVRLPVSHAKILETSSPARGDVAVFRYPRDPSIDYIKRIVGLPGDKITYKEKRLFINGVEMKIDAAAKPYIAPGARRGEVELQEYLGQVQHSILHATNRPGPAGESETWVVPEGHYFAMGDNRDNSSDSRIWGVVPEENLVGKAFLIWLNLDKGVPWSRIGTSIE